MKTLTLAICLALFGIALLVSRQTSQAQPAHAAPSPSLDQIMTGTPHSAHVNSGACACSSCKAIKVTPQGSDWECSCKGTQECKVTVAAADELKAKNLAQLGCLEDPTCGN